MSIEQEHTAVPFSYRARLEWSEPVPNRPQPEGYRPPFGDRERRPASHQMHHMALSGRVHPKAHSVQEATALFAEKIQPLLDLGWVLRSVAVKGYDEADA